MKNPVRLFVLAILSLFFSCAVPSLLLGKGVNFIRGSWNEVQSLALQKEKPVFVKVHADWCIPCKDLDTKIFSENEVGAYYNEHFINYIIDVDSPEGIQFKNQYKVNFIPDLLFFAPDGQLLFRNNNLNNKVQVLAIAYNALHQSSFKVSTETPNEYPHSERPVVNMSIELMQKQFDAGFQSPDFLHDFAYVLEDNELPYEEVVNKYLQKERKKKRLFSDKNQQFIFHFSENAETEALDILLQEKISFARNYGLQNINKKIKNALFNSALQAAFTKDSHLFKRVTQLAKKAELSDEAQFLYILESKYFEYLKDWKNYIEVTYSFMEKYEDNDPIFLNNQAISILRVSENKETLKQARKWTEKSIFLNPQDYNYQTYAYILYKLGEVKAAKVASSKASKFNQKKSLENGEPKPSDYLKT